MFLRLRILSTLIRFLILLIIDHHGSGVNLLKVGTKRRRTTREVKAEKEEAEIKEQAVNAKMQQFDQMANQIA